MSIAVDRQRRLDENERAEKQQLELAIRFVVKALDARDPYTKNHSVEVADISRLIAEEIDEDTLRKANEIDKKAAFVEQIYFAALLHDIGKIGVKESILLKKGRLDMTEKWEMDTHAFMGAEMLIEAEGWHNIREIIMHHHESYDGNRGYPHGLKKDTIPLGSRIIAIADSFHAMTSNRPYRCALHNQMAYDEIRLLSEGFKIDGKTEEQQYDPSVFEAFKKAIIKSRENRASTLFENIEVNERVFDDNNFLLTRVFFEKHIEDVVSKTNNEPFCIALMCLNSCVNNAHGTKALYSIKRRMLPRGALFSNYEDNRYVIYFPNTRIKEANILCNEIRDRLSKETEIAIDIGIVEVTNNKSCEDFLSKCVKSLNKAITLDKGKGMVVLYNDIHC